MLLVCASLDTHTRMLMYMLGISDNLDRDKVLRANQIRLFRVLLHVQRLRQNSKHQFTYLNTVSNVVRL